MNTGQMLIVLLATILFSTIVITLYNNMFSQVEMAERNVYFSQGIKIADFVFQRFETEMISKKKTFNQLYEEFKNSGIDLDSLSIGSAVYKINVRSMYSTVDGVTDSAIVGASQSYQRLFVKVKISVGKRTYNVGTDDYPFSKVFSDMGF